MGYIINILYIHGQFFINPRNRSRNGIQNLLNKWEILVLKNFKGQYKQIISSDYGILIRNVSKGVAAQRGVPQPLKTQRTLTVQGNSED